MPLQLTLQKIQPFLTPNPLKPQQHTLVEAWLPVLGSLLNKRYSIDDADEPVYINAAADAIQLRLDKPNRMVNSQSVNGASVSYASSLSFWFSPAVLDELDLFSGQGGVRSVRTPAPDSIRFGNLLRKIPGDHDELRAL